MSTAQVQQIISQMSGAIGANSGLGGTLKLTSATGSVLIDGKSSPNTVGDGAGKNADCTISVTLDTFEKMVKGELDGTSAFMQGKLRVAGDMGLAMSLALCFRRLAAMAVSNIHRPARRRGLQACVPAVESRAGAG